MATDAVWSSHHTGSVLHRRHRRLLKRARHLLQVPAVAPSVPECHRARRAPWAPFAGCGCPSPEPGSHDLRLCGPVPGERRTRADSHPHTPPPGADAGGGTGAAQASLLPAEDLGDGRRAVAGHVPEAREDPLLVDPGEVRAVGRVEDLEQRPGERRAREQGGR